MCVWGGRCVGGCVSVSVDTNECLCKCVLRPTDGRTMYGVNVRVHGK